MKRTFGARRDGYFMLWRYLIAANRRSGSDILHLRYLFPILLAKLEPFALDLWREEIITWLPRHCADGVRKRLVFGGLYQLVVTYR